MINPKNTTQEVSTNKYLRGNIKKMKIGVHNYAYLVNYAKNKFVSN
jgi:hypothetical protein